jgi:hypothetical protein
VEFAAGQQIQPWVIGITQRREEDEFEEEREDEAWLDETDEAADDAALDADDEREDNGLRHSLPVHSEGGGHWEDAEDCAEDAGMEEANKQLPVQEDADPPGGGCSSMGAPVGHTHSPASLHHPDAHPGAPVHTVPMG